MARLEVNSSFWSGKKVLISGHTGFKGSWLSIWLKSLGANIIGVSLDPPSSPNLYDKAHIADDIISHRQDIRDLKGLTKIFQKYNPEIVFHLAAQSLVKYSYSNPVETYETNVMGTLNILEAIKNVRSVKAVIMVTSDKCYENTERFEGYVEDDPMGGYDPYSSSKGASELLISSYRNSFFTDTNLGKNTTSIASVRAGNVIGGGDWAQDRLIPDIIHAFQKKEEVKIRNPHAVRPWQHVLEPLSGYMRLAELLFMEGSIYAQAWNFGPNDKDARPVEWIVERIAYLWGDNSKWSKDKNFHEHEAAFLKLNCTKALKNLNWKPKWTLEEALTMIVEWHKEEDLYPSKCREICLKQIQDYQNK